MRTASRLFLRHLSRAALCLPLLAGSAHADTWVPLQQQWLGLDGYRLGSSIAVGVGQDAQGHLTVANRVYVGQPYASDGTLAECGSVQVYVPGAGGWVPAATLYATSRQAGAHFGASMAYGSGHLLVGAPDYNSVGGVGAGAGYVEFFFDNGAATPSIASRGSRIGNGGNFGSAVAVNIDMAAVGIPNASGGDGCVSAFHYDLATSNWVNLPTLNDVVCGSGGEELGASVAIRRTSDSSYLLVAGAPGANTLAGAAHVYLPNPNTAVGGLLPIQTLNADSPGSFDFFGTSVGIDSDYVYVGATGRDNGAGRVGSVTIFKPAAEIGFDYLNEYFPGAPATLGGHCGASLNVDVNNAEFILGCPDSDDPYYPKVGSARVYRRITFLGQPVWLESVLSYGAQPHNANFSLGRSVAIVGNQAFAGAPNAYVSGHSGNGAWKAFLPDQIFKDGFGP